MIFLLSTAQTKANHARFIKRVVKQETVWVLSFLDGIANSESHENDNAEILMFWSDKAYANRVKNGPYAEYYEDYNPESIELFEFLYRWLPGMSSDKVLAGTNWNQGLVGTEIDPFQLREEIENAMRPDLRTAYEAKYENLIA